MNTKPLKTTDSIQDYYDDKLKTIDTLCKGQLQLISDLEQFRKEVYENHIYENNRISELFIRMDIYYKDLKKSIDKLFILMAINGISMFLLLIYLILFHK